MKDTCEYFCPEKKRFQLNSNSVCQCGFTYLFIQQLGYYKKYENININ